MGSIADSAVDRPMKLVWTEQRDADMHRFWADGLSAREIGKRLGISRNAVLGRKHRLGAPTVSTERRPAPPLWTDADDARLNELRAAGNTSAQIAKALGRGPKSVKYRVSHLRSRGLPLAPAARVYPPKPKKARRSLMPVPVRIVATTDEVQVTGASITDLAANQCKWPSSSNPVVFACTHSRAVKHDRNGFRIMPYCADHCRIAYQPAAERVAA